MSAWLVVALLALGATSGLLAGLFGIGGGIVMVPLMTTLLIAADVDPAVIMKVAIATSLTTILFTSAASVREHHRHGAVRWDVFRVMAPGIVVGAYGGAQFAASMRGHWLALLFAMFVVATATQVLLHRPRTLVVGEARPVLSRPLLLSGGVTVGALSALLGGGGGFATVPFLLRIGVPLRETVATSSACGLPIAVAGALGYMVAGWNTPLPGPSLGFVYLPAALLMALTSMLTAPLGARMSHRMPPVMLRNSFAALLYALAIMMFWKAWRYAA